MMVTHGQLVLAAANVAAYSVRKGVSLGYEECISCSLVTQETLNFRRQRDNEFFFPHLCRRVVLPRKFHFFLPRNKEIT